MADASGDGLEPVPWRAVGVVAGGCGRPAHAHGRPATGGTATSCTSSRRASTTSPGATSTSRRSRRSWPASPTRSRRATSPCCGSLPRSPTAVPIVLGALIARELGGRTVLADRRGRRRGGRRLHPRRRPPAVHRGVRPDRVARPALVDRPPAPHARPAVVGGVRRRGRAWPSSTRTSWCCWPSPSSPALVARPPVGAAALTPWLLAGGAAGRRHRRAQPALAGRPRLAAARHGRALADRLAGENRATLLPLQLLFAGTGARARPLGGGPVRWLVTPGSPRRSARCSGPGPSGSWSPSPPPAGRTTCCPSPPWSCWPGASAFERADRVLLMRLLIVPHRGHDRGAGAAVLPMLHGRR